MSGHGLKLNHKQESAIAALLTADSVTAAAHSLGLNEKTLVRWLQDGTFQRAYRQARRSLVDRAITQVLHQTTTAVEVIVAIMLDADAPMSTRLSAAKSIVDLACKTVELQDIEQRLADLEALVREPTV
jgi:hypothetical protein